MGGKEKKRLVQCQTALSHMRIRKKQRLVFFSQPCPVCTSLLTLASTAILNLIRRKRRRRGRERRKRGKNVRCNFSNCNSSQLLLHSKTAPLSLSLAYCNSTPRQVSDNHGVFQPWFFSLFPSFARSSSANYLAQLTSQY